MTDLFKSDEHDVGCKRPMRMLPGIVGSAEFAGTRQEHRLTLMRRPEGDHFILSAQPFWLWIGLNPSVAAEHVDDHTCHWEQVYTFRRRVTVYVKGNIGTYRCTDPDGLSVPGVEPVHHDNFARLLRLARAADRVVIACGVVPDVLKPSAERLFAAFREVSVPMWCLGLTKAGWPRHSSRLGYSVELERFRA